MIQPGKNFKIGQGIGDISSLKGMPFLASDIGQVHQRNTMRKIFLISMDATTDKMKDRVVKFLEATK